MNELLYSQPISRAAMRDSFGAGTCEIALKVTDAIKDDVAAIDDGARYFYETNLICESDDESEPTYKRVLWNRVPGCPMFPLLKERVYPPNESGGFVPYRLPKVTMTALMDYMQKMSPEIAGMEKTGAIAIGKPVFEAFPVIDDDSEQTIVEAFAMRTDRLRRVFGTQAIMMADEINAIIDTTCTYRAPMAYMKYYHPYYMEIWGGTDYLTETYRGLVYANLLRECPVFFPNKSGQTFLDVQYDVNNNPELKVKLNPETLENVRAIAAGN